MTKNRRHLTSSMIRELSGRSNITDLMKGSVPQGAGKVIWDLCSGTGSWSQPYKDAGYTVEVFDINQGSDVRLVRVPEYRVHGILAAHPCTDLCRSGARWWGEKGEEALLEALSIVDACLRIIYVVKPKWWALENPIGRIVHYLGEPQFKFDPFQYGDPYTKKTCLWGNFVLPRWVKTKPTEESRMHKMGESKARSTERSKTPQGFAYAFFKANP